MKKEKNFKEFDLVEFPIEGVAAYWLSLKKLLTSKKDKKKFLKKEIEFTTEPYIKHLLDLLLSSFDPNRIEKYARYKQETIINQLQKKLVIISIGILGISSRENSQQVLVRILSKFPFFSITEKSILNRTDQLLKSYSINETDIDVDHKSPIEELISNLLFHCMIARKDGPEICFNFLSKMHSFFFKEGLKFIIDGFDTDFIKHRLNLQQKEIIYATKRNMELSLEMCLGIKEEFSYNDLIRIVNSFLI